MARQRSKNPPRVEVVLVQDDGGWSGLDDQDYQVQQVPDANQDEPKGPSVSSVFGLALLGVVLLSVIQLLAVLLGYAISADDEETIRFLSWAFVSGFLVGVGAVVGGGHIKRIIEKLFGNGP